MRKKFNPGTVWERLKLTPEQLEIKAQIDQEQEEEEQQWERENQQRRLADRKNEIMAMLDLVNEHPMIKQIFSIKSLELDIKERYKFTALPAVIQAHPEWGTQEIADFVHLLAAEMVKE